MLDKETVEDIAFEAMQKGALAVIMTVVEGIDRGATTDDIRDLLIFMKNWHTSGECREEIRGDSDDKNSSTHH